MLPSNQKVHVGCRGLFLVIKFVNIRFAVCADQHLRLGHLARQHTTLLQGPDPPSALFLITGLLVAAGRVAFIGSRPYLRPAVAQRDTVQAKGLQAMQEYTPTVAFAEGPQTGG